MARVWSDEAKLASWLEVELAALEAWGELDAVPAAAVVRIRERAVPPTPEQVAEIALALQVREAGALLRDGVDRAVTVVVERAWEHKQTLTIGRTHGVHAE